LAHRTAIKLDGLSAGKYEPEIANNNNFIKAKNNNANVTPIIDFFVNNRTLINLGKHSFQLFNRKTGKPIENKSLKLWNDNEENNRIL
jgi:hypothetical protein